MLEALLETQQGVDVYNSSGLTQALYTPQPNTMMPFVPSMPVTPIMPVCHPVDPILQGLANAGSYIQHDYLPSDVQPVENFGVGGGGLAWQSVEPVVERVRFDDSHHAPHLNYEVMMPLPNGRAPMLTQHRVIDLLP